MKCAAHQSEAVAICAYCGRGRRVVLSAVAVFDLVLRGVRFYFYRVGNLAVAPRAQAKF
ncbi:MAG TPA: hypothetical protein VGI63_09380 [Verrucomicrobiae bacterium]